VTRATGGVSGASPAGHPELPDGARVRVASEQHAVRERTADAGLGSDLLDRTERLVGVPSLSGEEATLADLLEGELRAASHLRVFRIGDNLVARTELGRPERVVLAGHLDTVPGAQGVRREPDRVVGLGAADMKGGLAVLWWLAAVSTAPSVDATFVFYTCEEVSHERSGLEEVYRTRPELLAGDVALLLEPTAAVVEAGCQGVLHLEVVLAGRRAHTARPWTGVNAIHRLAPLLAAISNRPTREVPLDGCTYREALEAVDVSGGIAGNVVPDRVRLSLNHRFAPDRNAEGASEALARELGELIGPEDQLVVRSTAPAARPELSHPALAALVRASGSPARAKLGWTDVARFAGWGTPAANFGPGEPTLAHTAGEWVSRDDLVSTATTLRALLERGWSEVPAPTASPLAASQERGSGEEGLCR
jgi:succinyl-diaminopimelate desuccinylase